MKHPSKIACLTYDEVNAAINTRGQKILEKFRLTSSRGLKNSELLAVINDVKIYWKDLFRPALTSFSCEAVGGTAADSEDVGLMFTLASAGFGIHDDIIDKSPNKHFRKTIVGVHGVDRALLAGDLLIAKAWTIVHEMIRKTSQPTKVAEIVEVYGNAAIEICEGEFLETLYRKNLEVTVDCYEKMLWTAMAEIEACARIGAIVGNGEPNEVQALANFGRRLGFIYRLADDITDCLNIKGDLLHRVQFESVPLPLLFASNTSREKHDKIKGILENQLLKPDDARVLLETCFETEAFDYLIKSAKRNEEEATRSLRSLKPSQARNILEMMVHGSYSNLVSLCQ